MRTPGWIAAATLSLVACGVGAQTPATLIINASVIDGTGAPQQLVLMERREVGDDRIYTYRADFRGAMRYVRVGLAPDGRVAAFSLRTRP